VNSFRRLEGEVVEPDAGTIGGVRDLSKDPVTMSSMSKKNGSPPSEIRLSAGHAAILASRKCDTGTRACAIDNPPLYEDS
jgi:hypothetical protein